MKKLLLLVLFVCIGPIKAQSYDDANEAKNLCLLVQGSIGNNFTNDRDAEDALDKILSVIGASKRFVLQPCNKINNAVATSYKGIRYILYDRQFMNTIANKSSSWSQLSILAHEVGHHINGHSIDILLAVSGAVKPKQLASKRKQELESDEFSGFILGKLGATLDQASEAINMLSSNRDDTYSSHPSKSKRLNAIKIGYYKALENRPVVYEEKTNQSTAEEYFYKGVENAKYKDFYEAISNFNKSIRYDPYNYYAYLNIASAKDLLGDRKGAITDLTKAINTNSKISNAYVMRAGVLMKGNFEVHISNVNVKEVEKAIDDYTKAIEIDPNAGSSFYFRGMAKAKLGSDRYSACQDLLRAKQMGVDISRVNDYCDGIVINIPNENNVINTRNKSYDSQKSSNNAQDYLNTGTAKNNSRDYKGAIADYTKAIELNPNYTLAYANRGISKENLGNLAGACADWRKAANLGDKDSAEWVKNQCDKSQSSSNDDNESLTTIITKIEGKIKDKPKPLGNIISYIKPNIKLKAIGIEGSYWKIFFNGDIAYISDIYIYQSETSSDFKNSIPNKYKNFAVEVTTKILSKLRYEPSSASDIKMRIPKDEIIYVIGFKKPFWKIFYKGEEGYLYDGLYFDNSYRMMKFKE